jgi:hypothetical protein
MRHRRAEGPAEDIFTKKHEVEAITSAGASGRTPSRAAGQTAEFPGGKERIMMDGMGGMGWMGGVWLVWLLAIVALVLAIIALVKYLRSK